MTVVRACQRAGSGGSRTVVVHDTQRSHDARRRLAPRAGTSYAVLVSRSFTANARRGSDGEIEARFDAGIPVTRPATTVERALATDVFDADDAHVAALELTVEMGDVLGRPSTITASALPTGTIYVAGTATIEAEPA